MLNVIRHGTATDLPPLLIVHGLFGSARNWGAIAKRLSDSRAVWAVDMRNHGESFRAESQSYAEMAADLAEVLQKGPRRADVLGHSMGGKAAMMLALSHPELVNRLVVADIAPVAYGHSQAHLVQAMRALPLGGLDSRRMADDRLALQVQTPAVRAFLLQSLDLRANPPRWRLNLDVLESEMEQVIGWPDVSGQYTGRTLFLSGADSDYVRPEHRAAIKALFPKARFARIPGAGHWLHAEKPREFEAALRAFLT